MAVTGDYDVVSRAFQAHPFPELDRMRADGAVVRAKLPILGRTWLAVTHDACSTLLKDQESFVRDARNAGKRSQLGMFWWLPRTIKVLANNMLGHDDPQHRRLRGLVDQAFARRGIEAVRPMIADVVDRLLDRLERRTEVDLMTEFCRDLPLSVICLLLGLPERDHERFKRWMGGLADTANVGAVLVAVPGIVKVIGYLRQAIRPGSDVEPDGLIAALREVDIEGRRLSEDEMLSMIFLLFGAGQETTTHLIGGGLYTILAHEDQRRRLQDDWTLLPLCVEECLRHVSPVQMSKPRFVVRDMNFGGVEFRKGDSLVAFLAAANSDPAKFENAHDFDIGRHPNPHISFGTGVHFCLGFQLARAEAAAAFEGLFKRFPDIRLAVEPGEAHWRKRFGLRSLKTLPVRLAA